MYFHECAQINFLSNLPVNQSGKKVPIKDLELENLKND